MREIRGIVHENCPGLLTVGTLELVALIAVPEAPTVVLLAHTAIYYNKVKLFKRLQRLLKEQVILIFSKHFFILRLCIL